MGLFEPSLPSLLRSATISFAGAFFSLAAAVIAMACGLGMDIPSIRIGRRDTPAAEAGPGYLIFRSGRAMPVQRRSRPPFARPYGYRNQVAVTTGRFVDDHFPGFTHPLAIFRVPFGVAQRRRKRDVSDQQPANPMPLSSEEEEKSSSESEESEKSSEGSSAEKKAFYHLRGGRSEGLNPDEMEAFKRSLYHLRGGYKREMEDEQEEKRSWYHLRGGFKRDRSSEEDIGQDKRSIYHLRGGMKRDRGSDEDIHDKRGDESREEDATEEKKSLYHLRGGRSYTPDDLCTGCVVRKRRSLRDIIRFGSSAYPKQLFFGKRPNGFARIGRAYTLPSYADTDFYRPGTWQRVLAEFNRLKDIRKRDMNMLRLGRSGGMDLLRMG